MCGIALAVTKKPIAREVLDEVMFSLKNRGPDNQSYEMYRLSNFFIYMIHSRLSIVDLNQRSNQPYEYENHSIIFNGEIYNYLELKNELELKNYKFETSSDTEVLIKYIHCFGIEKTMNSLDGMFAFICLDTSLSKIFIARDRFGEKPLYYYENSGEIFFASETRILQNLVSDKLQIDLNSIYRFIKFGYRAINNNNSTFFKKVKSFRPSHFSCLNLENLDQKFIKYWSINTNQDYKNLNFNDAKTLLKNILVDTFESRFNADVPVAYFQSGGVDSNLISTIAKHELDYNTEGFYMSNSDSRYSEDTIVEESSKKNSNNVNKFNIDHEESFIETLLNQINYHNAPVYTTVDYCMFKLCENIKQKGFKVVLTGTGADEIFSGYYDHFILNFIDLKHNDYKKFDTEFLDWKKNVLPKIRNPAFQSIENYKNSNLNYIFQNNELSEDLFIKNFDFTFKECEFEFSNLRNRMANELLIETIPQTLNQDDLNCMHHSIENRSPYLSHKLVEFGYSIQQNHLANNGYLKNILREVGKDYADIQAFKNKTKVGFNYPTEKIINTESNQFKELMVRESEIYEFIDKEKFLNKLYSSKSLNNDESKTLFSIISSKLFMDSI